VNTGKALLQRVGKGTYALRDAAAIAEVLAAPSKKKLKKDEVEQAADDEDYTHRAPKKHKVRQRKKKKIFCLKKFFLGERSCGPTWRRHAD
jgi:hypothetical protein